MGSKIVVWAITLIGFTIALALAYFETRGANVFWAAIIFALSLLPAFLSLLAVLRLVHPEGAEVSFVYNQVLFGAVPGLLTILVISLILEQLMIVLIFYKEYGEIFSQMYNTRAHAFGHEISQQPRKDLTAALMSRKGQLWTALVISLILAAVRETGKYLMGHRVKGAPVTDSERPDMKLVVASFCAPVVGLVGMGAIFSGMTKIYLNPSIGFLLFFLLHDILDCAIDIGTALFMGLSACQTYVLGGDQKGFAALGIATLVRYLYRAIPGTVLAFKGTYGRMYNVSVYSSVPFLAFQIAVLLGLVALCRRVYYQMFPSGYMPPTSQSALV